MQIHPYFRRLISDKMKKFLLFLAAITVFISSCTIEKRRYTDGYHVEWNGKHDGGYTKNENIKSDKSIESVAVTSTETSQTEIVSSESVASETALNNETSIPSISVEKAEKSKTHLERRSNSNVPTAGVAGRKSIHKTFETTVAHTGVQMDYNHSGDTDTLLLILIAIFISPLAVFLHEGSWNTTCWINLILWLLFILPGFIHALIVILG